MGKPRKFGVALGAAGLLAVSSLGSATAQDLTPVSVVLQWEPQAQFAGYFAADGNAGESGAESGNLWRAHLSPDRVGQWAYTVSFISGSGVATSGVDVSRARMVCVVEGHARMTIAAVPLSASDVIPASSGDGVTPPSRSPTLSCIARRLGVYRSA